MSRLREHGSLRPIHSPAPSIAPLIIMKKKLIVICIIMLIGGITRGEIGQKSALPLDPDAWVTCTR